MITKENTITYKELDSRLDVSIVPSEGVSLQDILKAAQLEDIADKYERVENGSRIYTLYPSCGHEHDCCGCVCRVEITISIVPGFWVVQVAQSFNY